jgi:hypothetical protein
MLCTRSLCSSSHFNAGICQIKQRVLVFARASEPCGGVWIASVDEMEANETTIMLMTPFCVCEVVFVRYMYAESAGVCVFAELQNMLATDPLPGPRTDN